MPRIAGINLPAQKQTVIALTAIYGVGRPRARLLCEQAGVNGEKRLKDLSAEEEGRLREAVEKGSRVEGDLRRDVGNNIKRLKEIRCYRGFRHIKRLPARGQRTKTNSRTVRGNIRHTMRSGRRILTKT